MTERGRSSSRALARVLLATVGLSGCFARDVLLTEAGSFDIDLPEGTYAALYVASRPVVDGDTSEYHRAPAVVLTNAERGSTGYYRLAWDLDALYVAAQVEDATLEAIHDVRDDPVYQDDCLEVMFDTQADGGASMLNDDYKFFVNLLNQQYDRRGVTSPLPLWNATWSSAVAVDGTLNNATDADAGYRVEVAIPWAEWGLLAPEPGDVWGLNVVLDDTAGGVRSMTPWQGTLSGDAYFNLPGIWGRLEFWDEPRLYD